MVFASAGEITTLGNTWDGMFSPETHTGIYSDIVDYVADPGRQFLNPDGTLTSFIRYTCDWTGKWNPNPGPTLMPIICKTLLSVLV